MNKFIIYINYGDSVIEYVLPGLDNRKGDLDLSSETGIKGLILSYEVWDQVWQFKTNQYVRLSFEHYTFESRELKDGEVYTGKVYASGVHFSIMVKVFREDMASFSKFSLIGIDTLSVGSGRNNYVCINSRYVSNCHAILSYQNKRWYLFDKSKNGTYLYIWL